MARRSREVGIIKSCVLGAALALALAMPAQAQDKKIAISATTAFVTDYLFRGISNTNGNPAAQPEIDITYGMFYIGMWGSNTTVNPDSIEIDYYGGITPKWGNITFDIAGLIYTFPGSNSLLDYFELKTGATYAKGPWSLRVTNYWSPDFANAFNDGDAIEGQLGYAFSGKLFNFFSPSVSGGVGFQALEKIANDYTYWNAGLTLGFMEHWSVDVRYSDTSYSTTECGTYVFAATGFRSNNCDATVVGTVKAVF
jgi:uncharacterized protein (TIGR02001 family)